VHITVDILIFLSELGIQLGLRSRCNDWLRAGRSRIRILAGTWMFCFPKTYQTDSIAHAVSCSVRTGIICLW